MYILIDSQSKSTLSRQDGKSGGGSRTGQEWNRAAPDAPTPAAEVSASRPGRRRPRGWRSPLTRRILTINVLVLLIPVLGLMHLDQYRDSLNAADKTDISQLDVAELLLRSVDEEAGGTA